MIYFILGEIAGDKGGSQELKKLLDLAPPSIRRELGADLAREIETFQIIGFAPEELVGKMREKNELKKLFQGLSRTMQRALQLSQR